MNARITSPKTEAPPFWTNRPAPRHAVAASYAPSRAPQNRSGRDHNAGQSSESTSGISANASSVLDSMMRSLDNPGQYTAGRQDVRLAGASDRMSPTVAVFDQATNFDRNSPISSGRSFAPSESLARQMRKAAVEAALNNIDHWHAGLKAEKTEFVQLGSSDDYRCCLTQDAFADIKYRVALRTGDVVHVFDAESILTWMQTKLQAGTDCGDITNPVNRRSFCLEDLVRVELARSNCAANQVPEIRARVFSRPRALRKKPIYQHIREIQYCVQNLRTKIRRPLSRQAGD